MSKFKIQDEGKEYQKFILKTLYASREFVEDYNKLSPKNKLRFQNELEIELDLGIVRELILFLQNRLYPGCLCRKSRLT